MKESIGIKLMPQFEKLNQIGIKAVVGLTDVSESRTKVFQGSCI